MTFNHSIIPFIPLLFNAVSRICLFDPTQIVMSLRQGSHLTYRDFTYAYTLRVEKIKWPEEVTNQQVLQSIGEKWTLLNNILPRKTNWIGHILRRNCLHHAIEGHMMEVKGVARNSSS